MTSTHRTYIELPITVGYAAYPFIAGQTDGFGAPIEPDEPAHIEIELAQLEDGTNVALTKEQRESIEEEISEALAERSDD